MNYFLLFADFVFLAESALSKLTPGKDKKVSGFLQQGDVQSKNAGIDLVKEQMSSSKPLIDNLKSESVITKGKDALLPDLTQVCEVVKDTLIEDLALKSKNENKPETVGKGLISKEELGGEILTDNVIPKTEDVTNPVVALNEIASNLAMIVDNLEAMSTTQLSLDESPDRTRNASDTKEGSEENSGEENSGEEEIEVFNITNLALNTLTDSNDTNKDGDQDANEGYYGVEKVSFPEIQLESERPKPIQKYGCNVFTAFLDFMNYIWEMFCQMFSGPTNSPTMVEDSEDIIVSEDKKDN